jgi:hypothetical protein
MISALEQTFLSHISGKKKRNQNGWVSFNSICCPHNGESVDKRGRGGVLITDDSFSYSCFNCKFKTGYRLGGSFGFKIRNLFRWAGVSENTINGFVFEALRIKDNNITDLDHTEYKVKTTFRNRDLPENCFPISEWEQAGCDFDDFNTVKRYIRDRNLDPLDNRFYWTPNTHIGMNRSVIIPYTYCGNIVGFTSRTIDGRMPAYYNQSENNYVYGFDHQDSSWARTIICEGPFDAISIDGLALLGSELNDDRIRLINQLQTEKILVPDKDKDGYKMIETALDVGWKVSIPPWSVKDINAANQQLGKLVCLRLITEYATNSIIKIRMYMNG